jgi:hypothetical protein
VIDAVRVKSEACIHNVVDVFKKLLRTFAENIGTLTTYEKDKW